MSGCDHKWVKFGKGELCERCGVGAECVRQVMLEAFEKAMRDKLSGVDSEPTTEREEP